MNTSQRGAVGAPMLIWGIVLLVFLLGGAYYYARQAMPGEDAMQEQEDVMIEEGEPMTDKEDVMMEKEDIMIEKDGEVMQKTSYSGQVLAGSSAPLLVFNQADYDKAVAEGKLVVLYFYANWCPTCKAEFPKAEDAFDMLQSENVVGFRVNFNDNETDKDEEALAREFGVPYQHTKVFVQNGTQLLKSPEQWNTQRYIDEITSRL